jgi:cytochrome c
MSFEVNKILGSLLTALIIGIVAGLLSHVLVPTPTVEKPGYPIAVKEAPVTVAEAPADDKPIPVTPEMFAKADPAKGEDIARKCAQCHNWEKGGPNKIGPNLYNVIGRARATAPGFSYSDALKKLGGNWAPQDIANFIFKPSAYAPGTKMTFAGLPKPEDRADVLAFLNKQSDSPVDLSK